MIGRRVRADLFKFADVVVLFDVGGHQRPELFQLRFANVKKACADGRKQPFVQAGAVIIAVEVFVFKGEMRKGMGAVNDDFDAAFAPHLADAFDRKDLPGALKEMLEHKGTFLLEVMVTKENNVFPMVPQGCSVSEIRLK